MPEFLISKTVKVASNKNDSNSFDKYKVIKLVSSGDYVCVDDNNNNYALVHHFGKKDQDKMQDSFVEFKKTVPHFQRNRNNKAFLTPVQNFENQTGVFTVYFLPQNATPLADIVQNRKFSESFCLGILYAIITKIMKPLIEVFQKNTQNWVHFENFWVKKDKVFYLLHQRGTNSTSSQTQCKFVTIQQKQTCEKKLLRKLCKFLIKVFKFDPQLKSFQSTIFDSMLNEQFSINKIIEILKDKQQRNLFMLQRSQNHFQTSKELKLQSAEFWKKKKVTKPNYSNILDQYTNSQMHSLTLENPKSKDIQTPGGTFSSLKMWNRGPVRSPSIVRKLFDLSSKRRASTLSERKKKNSFSETNGSECSKTAFKNHVQRQYKIPVLQRKSYSLCISSFEKSKMVEKPRIDLRNHTVGAKQQKSFEQMHLQLRRFLSQSKERKQKLKEQQRMILKIKDKQMQVQKEKENSILTQKESAKVISKDEEENLKQKSNKNQLQKSIQVSFNEQDKYSKEKENYINRLDAHQPKSVSQIVQKQEKHCEQKQNVLKIEQGLQNIEVKQKIIKKQKEDFFKNIDQISFEKIEIVNAINSKTKINTEPEQSYKKITKPYKLCLKNQEVSICISKVSSKEQSQLEEIVLDSSTKKYEQQKIKQSQQLFSFMQKPSAKTKCRQENRKIENTVSEQNGQRCRRQAQKADLQHTEKKKGKQDDSKSQKRIQFKEQTMKLRQNEKQQPEKKIIESEVPFFGGNTEQKMKNTIQKMDYSQIQIKVNQYLDLINFIGQTVSRSSKLSSKLKQIQWFTGIYFLYKRFLYERKRIQKWLNKKESKICRKIHKNNEKNKQEQQKWTLWFQSQQKRKLQERLIKQNADIVSSIVKMNKKLLKNKNIHQTILHYANLSKFSPQESKISVSEVIKQFDTMQELNKLKDPEILQHINNLLICLEIVAELDNKIEGKIMKNIFVRRNFQQIDQFSDYLYDLYMKSQK